jgi:transcriptional regulator with XRE-family HTH domain
MEQESAYPGISTPSLEKNAGEERRRQLADFLRTRRASLVPAALGLPSTRRRRVNGLRREEVAEAAGISVAWYTWVEQGRDLNLSTGTLQRLSAALRLTEAEQGHLYRLAGHPPPYSPVRDDESVIPVLDRMIRAMEPNPAYVLDPVWNVVAWNADAVDLFGDFEKIPAEHRNMVRLVFLDEGFRNRFCNWLEVACCVLGHFRSDSAEHVEDAYWKTLVSDLNAGSEQFHVWWEHHNVTSPFHRRKEIAHPVHGRKVYDSLDLQLFQPGRYRIVTYVERIGSHSI